MNQNNVDIIIKNLHQAVFTNNLSHVDKILTDSSDLIDHFIDSFYHSCEKGQLHIVKAFVLHGIEFDDDDYLCLKKAAYYGHKDVVCYLLSIGAELNSPSFLLNLSEKISGNPKNAQDIFKILVNHGEDFTCDNNAILRAACNSGNLEIVEFLIQKHQADINIILNATSLHDKAQIWINAYQLSLALDEKTDKKLDKKSKI